MSPDKKPSLETVRAFVTEFLSKAQLEVSFELEQRDDEVEVRLTGPDAELALSRNGQVLYAMNHLLNQVFYRRPPAGLNFMVDCDGYRATRTLELQLLARKAAEKVRRSGIPVQLQPMPDVERRVIHLALAQEGGIRTESEGMGEQRRVVILPDAQES